MNEYLWDIQKKYRRIYAKLWNDDPSQSPEDLRAMALVLLVLTERAEKGQEGIDELELTERVNVLSEYTAQ